MGLGKTAQLVRAINTIPVDRPRGIIIAPAGLRENFINEWRKFTTKPASICKGKNIHDFIAWNRGRYDILVTSYEQAAKWAPMFAENPEPLEFWAADEAHYLKNGDSNRTKQLVGSDGNASFLQWAYQAWWLTGTPIPNDPADVYTFLRFLQVMPLSKNEFIKRYFKARVTAYGTRTETKREMLPELQRLIYNNSIRRTKEDVNLQLPDIMLTSVVVDGDTEEITNMIRGFPGLEESIMTAIEMGGISFLDAAHIATLRRLLGEAKAIPYAHMLLDELITYRDKRVVFGIHTEALRFIHDFLQRKGIQGGLFIGETKERDRIEMVRRFQEDPDFTYIIGNMKSMGTGQTLTAACEVDIFESAWDPATNAQAIMRIHRIGQLRKCYARFVTLARTFDVKVTQIVAEKVEAIAMIEGDAMDAAPNLA